MCHRVHVCVVRVPGVAVIIEGADGFDLREEAIVDFSHVWAGERLSLRAGARRRHGQDCECGESRDCKMAAACLRRNTGLLWDFETADVWECWFDAPVAGGRSKRRPYDGFSARDRVSRSHSTA